MTWECCRSLLELWLREIWYTAADDLLACGILMTLTVWLCGLLCTLHMVWLRELLSAFCIVENARFDNVF